jgi:hypothetical protein
MRETVIGSLGVGRPNADDRAVEDARFVVVAGDVLDLANDPDLQVIDRLKVVLLVRTTPERSTQLSARSDVVVSVYASEGLARIAFDLFRS